MIDLHATNRLRIWRRQGFTLLELLVAMAVLGLLVAMLAQTTALTGKAIAFNVKKLDADGQAHVVFDRLATDLAARPTRSDIGTLFTKATGNDSFQFYSLVDGYSGGRQVAAVGYRIQQTTPGRLFQLERGAVGTDWGPVASGNPFVQFLPSTLTAPLVSDPNYEVLANRVFRLEFCYQLNTGVLSNSCKSNLSNVTAIIVAVGVLDSISLHVVSSAQLQQLSTALPDDVEGQTPISGWNTAMALSTFGAGIPPTVIQNVRLYERSFCVP
jgi:prepilin-type N-terminal cleavage/methylation domain-containing protein